MKVLFFVSFILSWTPPFSMESSMLASLPAEVMERVLAHLVAEDPVTFWRCRRVCNRLRQQVEALCNQRGHKRAAMRALCRRGMPAEAYHQEARHSGHASPDYERLWLRFRALNAFHFISQSGQAEARRGQVETVLHQADLVRDEEGAQRFALADVTALLVNGDTVFVCLASRWMLWLLLPGDTPGQKQQHPRPISTPELEVNCMAGLKVSRWKRNWRVYDHLDGWASVHLDYDVLALACGREIHTIRLFQGQVDGGVSCTASTRKGFHTRNHTFVTEIGPMGTRGQLELRAFRGRLLAVRSRYMAEYAYDTAEDALVPLRAFKVLISEVHSQRGDLSTLTELRHGLWIRRQRIIPLTNELFVALMLTVSCSVTTIMYSYVVNRIDVSLLVIGRQRHGVHAQLGASTAASARARMAPPALPRHRGGPQAERALPGHCRGRRLRL